MATVRTPSSLNIVMVQELPVLGAPETNLASMERALAIHRDADLMVWPELFLSGYTTRSVHTHAEALDGTHVARARALAVEHDTAIVVGLIERDGDAIHNSALAIDRDGRIAGCYRKLQLFGDEARVFLAGQTGSVVSLCGVSVGLLICFDIEFPEPARALACAGAALLVSISANMVPFAPDHRLCVQARALENRRPHVYVNQVGQGESHHFTGQSAVADSAGQIRGECDGETEGFCQLELSLAVETDIRPDYLALHPVAALPVVRGLPRADMPA
ncbi:nitrilase-related carbon-nitrogen hydrolase [Salinisphaera sp. Q1T1-3]|uniref:nitrilase-related carbon-nitrogen hydrolase n=1 Tax=Salinisphaera sp. Q1T1-3 TaxID=2321229 RepID=UPI0013147287|nr:nitrilase-related carbon-nitrogen hydrolase [Salinisphaera sp. Q1T1-3]